ncbi:MAG: hypothetical protein JWQ09_768 [Segetibacter sp.]|nr:hypothetical protein [Segetibacter sp.]
MKKSFDKTTKQALVLGLISGLRATIAPSIAAHYLSKQPNSTLAKSKLGFIQSPITAVITKVLSAAEFTGDKLPNTPNRIIAGQVLARVASGALAGAIISTANKDNVAKGVFIGGVAAVASTYASYYLRKNISKSSYLKEPWTGAVEEVIAIGSGVLLMR